MGSIFSYFISVTQKNDLYSNILSFLAGLFASFFIISVYKNRKEYKFYITILFLFDAFAFSLLLILFNWGLTNNIRSNMLQAMMLKREQKMNQDLENLGCDEIQGFIFGKSVPPDTFETAHILPIKKQVMFSPVSSIL